MVPYKVPKHSRTGTILNFYDDLLKIFPFGNISQFSDIFDMWRPYIGFPAIFRAIWREISQFSDISDMNTCLPGNRYLD